MGAHLRGCIFVSCHCVRYGYVCIMRYTKPEDVRSPRYILTDLEILEHGDAYDVAIAKLKWNGKNAIGIRWNVSEKEWNDPEKKSGKKICVGNPVSRGYPTWFILPHDLYKEHKELLKKYLNQ